MATNSSNAANLSLDEPLPPDAAAPPVLEFAAVSVAESYRQHGGLRGADFQLRAGEVMLIYEHDMRLPAPLAALAQGMARPMLGKVCFRGQVWNDDDFARHIEMRGRIGRVFARWGWVSNLNVLENVVLARRHHTLDADGQIVADADAWARRFGLDEVPRKRPAFVPSETLRVSEWVRALLLKPDLLLLEQPMRDVAAEHLPALCQAVEEARRQSTAVVWTTANRAFWQAPPLSGARRFELADQRLEPVSDTPSTAMPPKEGP